MNWWNRKPEDRAQWVLDPLAGVGPLRFGMSPAQVEQALDGETAGVSQGGDDGPAWQRYYEAGVTTIHGSGSRLAAVMIDAMEGPLLRLRDIELIARAPSEVRAALCDLASREGVTVRVNWSGDPEVARWGLSMGAGHYRGGSAGGGDTMVTSALLTGPELADDPYRSEPVLAWRDVRELESNPGAWPVKAADDRPRWDWTPLAGVGPLRFGMSPVAVAAALGGETPAGRCGHFPGPLLGESGQWTVDSERFDATGVTAHYCYVKGLPELGAVTVHGRTGPQVSYGDIPLIGRPVSAVDAAVIQRIEDEQIGLLFGCGGDPGPDGLGMWVRAARAGDAAVSEARFCAAEWEDHG
jgi:hypothetical protein